MQATAPGQRKSKLSAISAAPVLPSFNLMAQEFKGSYNVRKDLFRAILGHRLEPPASRINKNPQRLYQQFGINAYRACLIRIIHAARGPPSHVEAHVALCAVGADLFKFFIHLPDLNRLGRGLCSFAGCQSEDSRDKHCRNQPLKQNVLRPRTMAVVGDHMPRGHIRRTRRGTYSARYINPKRKTCVNAPLKRQRQDLPSIRFYFAH